MKKEDMILARLDRMEEKIDVCLIDIAGLKVKAGIWGALAGLVPTTIGLAMWVLSLG